MEYYSALFFISKILVRLKSFNFLNRAIKLIEDPLFYK